MRDSGEAGRRDGELVDAEGCVEDFELALGVGVGVEDECGIYGLKRDACAGDGSVFGVVDDAVERGEDGGAGRNWKKEEKNREHGKAATGLYEDEGRKTCLGRTSARYEAKEQHYTRRIQEVRLRKRNRERAGVGYDRDIAREEFVR